MNYQEASKIRSSGLSDLVAAKLMSDQSIGDALKSSIDQKLKANAKGIREKFDILNIAKVLTGGSSVAPILIGNMLGREKEDIKYFADAKNRLEKILELVEENVKDSDTTSEQKEENKKSETNQGKQKRKTASRVKTDERVVGVVNQIYGLLKRELERKKLSQEILSNFDEEKKEEDERRHKELLKVLANLTVGGGTLKEKEKEQEEEEQRSLLGSILEAFGGAAVGKALIKRVGAFFLGAGGAALLGAAPLAIMFGVAQWAKSASIFDDKGELTGTGKVLDATQKALGNKYGMKPRSQMTPLEQLDYDTTFRFGQGGAKEITKKRYISLIEQGTKFTPEEAAILKKNLDIDVPKESIETQEQRTARKEQPAPEAAPNTLTPEQIQEHDAIKQRLVEAIKSGDKVKIDAANKELVDWAKRAGEKSGTATAVPAAAAESSPAAAAAKEESADLKELKKKRDAFGAAYVAMKKNPNTPPEALQAMEKNLMEVGEQIKRLEEPPAQVEPVSAVSPLGDMATKATAENAELTQTQQGAAGEFAPPVVSMQNKAINIGGQTVMAEVTVRTEEDTMDRLISRMMHPV